MKAPTRDLMAHFDALHVEFLDERAVIQGGKDGKLLSTLCQTHAPERIKELMRCYFESDDEFIQSAGYSIGLFVSQMPKLMAQQRKAQQLTGKGGYNVREAQAALEAMDAQPPQGLRRIR